MLGRDKGRGRFVESKFYLVYLGGEDEVVIEQPADGVRPEGDDDIAPAEMNVGVVPFALSGFPDEVHKRQSFAKVFETKLPRDFFVVRSTLPVRKNLLEILVGLCRR